MKNEWLTESGNFGPEVGFGHDMGQVLDEPVLVLKACIGNRSLGWDPLQPGSERYGFESKVYVGYRDVVPSWEKGAEPKAVNWYAGRQNDPDTAHVKAALTNLKKYFPGPKFVLTTGCSNPGRKGFGLKIAEAQLAAGNAKKYPEFEGNARGLDTRDLWREPADSPANQGYHDKHNAETYMERGLCLGWGMTDHPRGDRK